MSHVVTGASCLLTAGGRYVYEVRKPHKWERVPGLPPRIGLGGIGGTLEAGETPVQALRREVGEETGCDVELTSAPCTVEMSGRGTRVLPAVDVDGPQPALLWEVTDPTYEVGAFVAVFLGRTPHDPQPGDLPAIVLGDLDLLRVIGEDELPVGHLPRHGAELRARVAVPDDGRLVLANTLRRLWQLRRDAPALYATLCG